MKIEVTQEDIDQGIRYDSINCPISIATNRTLNKTVSIGCSHITILNIYKNIPLPFRAIQFIGNFDSNKEVKPFTFEIDYGNY